MTPLATVAVAVAVPWLWVGEVKSVAPLGLGLAVGEAVVGEVLLEAPVAGRAARPGLEAQGHRHDQAVAPSRRPCSSPPSPP